MKNDTIAAIATAPGTGGKSSTRESHYIETVKTNTVVSFDYLEIDGDGDTWYHITSGASKTGFLYTDKLHIISSTTPAPTYVYEEDFEKQLLYFPAGYRDSLRALHAKYSNFKFEPLYVGKTLNSCVYMQYSSTDVTKTKKYISLSTTNQTYIDQRAKQDDGTYMQPEKG